MNKYNVIPTIIKNNKKIVKANELSVKLETPFLSLKDAINESDYLELLEQVT